jgi:hypothetical protein
MSEAKAEFLGSLADRIECLQKEVSSLEETIQPCLREVDSKPMNDCPSESSPSSLVVLQARKLEDKVQSIINTVGELCERVQWV